MTSRLEAGRVSVEAMLESPLCALAVTDLLPLAVLAWDTCKAQAMCFNHTLLLRLTPYHCPKATTTGLGQATAQVHQQLCLSTGRSRQALSEAFEPPSETPWTEASLDWNALMLC